MCPLDTSRLHVAYQPQARINAYEYKAQSALQLVAAAQICFVAASSCIDYRAIYAVYAIVAAIYTNFRGLQRAPVSLWSKFFAVADGDVVGITSSIIVIQ